MYPTLKQSDCLERLQREKKAAIDFQLRKHTDWNDNYELYRNKVRTNRLTQRQAVNIPLMKETVKTILSRIDDPPIVEWKELGGDELKELYYQEIWNAQFKNGKLEWLDVLDKKNVLLYGLSTKVLNPTKDGVDIHVLDVFDVLYDPLMQASDIESARYIIRQNIYRSVREIMADDRYTKEGRDQLKIWAMSDAGLVQSNLNKEEAKKKNERMQAMGVSDSDFAHFAAGDTLINLTEHFTKEWNMGLKKFEKRVVVYANDLIELMNEKLTDLIGVDFWPFVMWSEDPETNDVYPDGVADLVRTPNKIVNVWFSQLVENRTLRNFQMHWYDSTVQGYTPQTYEPGPGRMLPSPGNPNEKIMPVEISGLDESLTAIDYLTSIVERGTGATAIEKGVGEQSEQTLGEVRILVGKAMERSVSMAKFYRGSWYELCVKWDALMHANAPRKMALYKTSQNGKLYQKTVYSSEWKSEAGYEPIVRSSSEQEEEATKGIQKWMFILQQFPQNLALKKIGQKRMLEIVDMSPEELREVTEEEEAQAEALKQQQANQALQPQQMPEQPQQQQAPEDISAEIAELSQLTQ